jgi:hypothetical protein
MRLYGAIQKVEPLYDGTVRVHGIATSEAVDEQGEIVRADAMRAAIPDYMRFPALREMHQLSAAGTTLEAEVCEDGTTRIVAHVVDPVAVAKVKNQVYRGFSIGGRITQREAGNPQAITSLVLNEISLVDRPANPEAIFDCWKAAIMSDAAFDGSDIADGMQGPATSARAPLAQDPFNAPMQIWSCPVPDHRHLAKTDAVKCLEKLNAGSIEPKIAIAAATPAVAEEASRAALTKALWDVGRVARVIVDLDWLKDALDLEATIATDDSPQPARLQAMIAELCGFLNALATEETGELHREMDDAALTPVMSGTLAMAAGAPRAANLLRKGKPNMRNVAAGLLAKAKHSLGDQALMDMAHLACDKCLKIGGLAIDEREDVRKARDHLQEAGAVPIEDSTDETIEYDEGSAPGSDSSVDNTVKTLSVIAAALGKRGRVHQHLMDVAYDCLGELTGGTICRRAGKLGARHLTETMDHFEAAHRHLVAAGARRDAAGIAGTLPLSEEQRPGGGSASGKAISPGDLAKALAGERVEKAVLVEALGEIVPMLERLTKRVDDIARTPLPPLTIAKGTASISKQQDRVAGADPQLSSETIASALAKMTKEEQTLMLIKASYANPIRVIGSTADEP